MSDIPLTRWLTIIGIGEDGYAGLAVASQLAISDADIVMGAARHLSLLPALKGESVVWPVPFVDGLPQLLAFRGKRVVALASGDPFHYGAGLSITRLLDANEWTAHPAPSTFGWAAARLGWSLQDVICLGVHAAPIERVRPHLATSARLLILIRDGAAVEDMAHYLTQTGFGLSTLHVMESLGGPRERVRTIDAAQYDLSDVEHPVLLAIEVEGEGDVLPTVTGRPDHWFDHDGQITKSPIRALTLAALAPRTGELLWDIGGGSGSISIEWLLAHPANRACVIESHDERAARITANAKTLGVDRLSVTIGRSPHIWPDGPAPDAIFIGGGLSQSLLKAIWDKFDHPIRLVANAVTLESEALLMEWHSLKGGSLLRIELSDVTTLGSRRGWRARHPILQWSVSL